MSPASEGKPVANSEAERLVLGAMLLDPTVPGRVAGILKAEAFYNTGHRELYRQLMILAELNKPTDLTSVSAWLQDIGKLEQVGGTQQLADMVEAVTHTHSVEQVAGLVAEKARRREIIRACTEVATAAQDSNEPVDELVDRMQTHAASVALAGPARWLHAAIEDVQATVENTRARMEGRLPPGIPTGFYDLDGMTQGLQRGDLVILAARPAMGKTAFALNIAANIAAAGEPVVIVSLEMSGPQLAARLISTESGVGAGVMRSGHLSAEQWERISDGGTRVGQLPLWISDRSNAGVAEIRSHCQQLSRSLKRPLGLVAIDYLQLMQGSGGENRVQELSRITRGLKQMARDLATPVMALSQLSRGVEARTNKRPMLSDLRDSGAIEADADLVLMLYRDEYYNQDSGSKGLAEVLVTKHRNGPVGSLELLFQPEVSRFRSVAKGGPGPWAP